MANDPSTTDCACPGCTCKCSVEQTFERDGKQFCSQACADLHPKGQPCPSSTCHCEQNLGADERNVSDSKLDQAVEETFPASDPISP